MTDPAQTETTGRTGGIVVGVDGSPSSVAALRWAVGQAVLTGQTVHAITAWQFPVAYGPAYVVDDRTDWAEDSRSILRATVESVLAGAATPEVEQHVVHAHPVRALLEAAAGAELLVVGSRGHGGFTGMLLGSVSQQLVTHALCPVLVVHSPEGRPR